MLRHINRYSLFLVLPLVFAGCADTGLDSGIDGSGGEMAFEIGFAGDTQTRVATDAGFNSMWEDGDQIGVFAVKHDETLAATDNYIDNLRLTYDAAANTWTSSTPVYWPQDGSALDFYAYHPYDAAFDPTAAEFSVQADQSVTNYNVSDLLMTVSNNGGEGYAKGTASVPLEFRHAMAMVQMTLDNSTGLLDTSGGITVTLREVQTSAGLDLVAGKAMATGEKSDITMHRVTDAAGYIYRALVPAGQTFAAGTSLFHITDGATTFRSTALTEALTLVAGQAETFGQRIPLPNVETATLVFTDGGDPATVTARHIGDGLYQIDPSGEGSRTAYSLTLRGKTHLVGRKDNETFTLKIVPATGELQFRDAVDDGNDGTAIPIGTYAEFALINTDNTTLEGKYLQEGEIDLLGAAELETAGLVRQNWIPIGTDTKRFTGSYDGGGHTLANLYIDSDQNNIGLFGIVDQNGTLSRINITSGSVTGNNGVGGVCGYNNGNLSGCANAAAITGKEETAGVCGRNHQTMVECVNTGKVSGTNKVGGVCGWNDNFATVSDSHNTGAIEGEWHLGGVCGQNGQHDILTGCSNTGSVTCMGESAQNTGGICGNNFHIIEKCNNEGTVSGRSYVGGVCGHNDVDATITTCTNTGSVTGRADYIGGVCGMNIGGTVTTCTNTGSITGARRAINTGGVCGANYRIIEKCNNEGTVSGWDYVGGMCGKNHGEITACNNTGTVSARHYIGGVCGENTVAAAIITECCNTAEVTGGTRTGGICGSNRGTIDLCRNHGNVTVKPWVENGVTYRCYNGGGVCGDNYGIIGGSYNEGAVSGVENVGGVSGTNRSLGIGELRACYNAGAVKGTDDFTGGVVGINESLTIACYNTAVVTGVYDVGGVCGRNYVPEGQPQAEQRAELVGCYNTGDVWIEGNGYVGEVCGYNNAVLGVINCFFRDGNTAIGGGGQPDTDFDTFRFGSNVWPVYWDAGWGLIEPENPLYTGDWGDLGGWNSGNPEYPRLWWEVQSIKN